MQFSQKEWSALTKSALKAWHHPLDLGGHPLTQLWIVQLRREEVGLSAEITDQAQALRDVLKQAINTLAPPGSIRPTSDDDTQWLDPIWRSWSLLTLLYLRRKTRGLVQARIGMAEGGQYYKALRTALQALVTILQQWETTAQLPKLALRWPSGAVHLDDPLYIERAGDSALQQSLKTSGHTVTIRGARQVGKTSLLVRGVEVACRDNHSRVVYIDLQAIPQTDIDSYDNFLRLFAEWLLDELELDMAQIEKAWSSRLGAARKLTKLIERVVLPASDAPLIIALDEVDRLTVTSFASDFFGLLRSWHNLRSRNVQWEKLTMLLAISTEPYLLIEDLQQSPFNVGQTLHLQDFPLAALTTLNQRHGDPLTVPELDHLLQWGGGQPFLTRLAFYILATQQLSLAQLIASAENPDSPFADHLAHLLRLLQNDELLARSLRIVLDRSGMPDKATTIRLLKAGLIRPAGAGYACRCELYHSYFNRYL